VRPTKRLALAALFLIFQKKKQKNRRLQITLVTRVEHVTGNYISLANYQADKNGTVDTTREASVGGSFKGNFA
jgi:thiamine biosynthesis lipoprotein ApbE